MAPKTSAQRRARSPQQDRIDNYLFDEDVDPFATPEPETQSSKPKDGQGLGIEEEVTVAKRARVPRVKLDETRLLSEAGIPKLRKKARDLKLKGKGHEFSDAARLLSFYQVWLDDLFPKAKFLDALAMVEKAGHKTTMHKERMDWINEGKPNPADDLTYEADEAPADAKPTRIAPVFDKASSGRPKTPAVHDPFDEEDLYAATPGARRLGTAPATNGAGSRGGEPDEDDLDALMAEAEAHQSTSVNGPSTSIFGSGRTGPKTQKTIAEDDDLDALMAEAEAQGEERIRGQPATEKPNNTDRPSLFGSGRPQLPAPSTGDDPDDLDALMAEAEAQTGPPGRAGSASQKKAAGPPDSFADEEEAMAEMDGLCLQEAMTHICRCKAIDAAGGYLEIDCVSDKNKHSSLPWASEFTPPRIFAVVGLSVAAATTSQIASAPPTLPVPPHAKDSQDATLVPCAFKMTQDIADAMGRLHLAESPSIDDILFSQAPRKRRKQDPASLKAELEKKHLSPSTTFSAEWLNKLQQRWDCHTDQTFLFKMAPTQTRTVTRFLRQGLEGRVTGYKNVTVPATSTTAKNSTSLLRKPANRADFVRGAAGYFPFAPGGLEGIEAAAAFEDQVLRSGSAEASCSSNKLERVIKLGAEGGLLEVAPGLEHGIDFSKKKTGGDEAEAKAVENELDQEPEQVAEDQAPQQDGGEDATDSSTPEAESREEDGEDIDALLPVEFPALEPRGTLAASSARKAGREWAHMVDIQKGIPNFRELVPDMAREWPFELDNFQKEAIYHLENGDSVFVAAHTSAGKTVVAEYAIALAARHMTKAIYTSPIKALSNQKFRDFRNTFDEVGILTGDVQINPEASCLIMTTEILRSMLYRGADLIRDVEYVIFDEVHYVNDFERGVVWEEVIIMLPQHVSLILLSATVPNTYEFASWVGRTKQKDIYVISTPKRPVPLEHYLWGGKNIHKIVDSSKTFIEKGWKEANNSIQGNDKPKVAQAAPTGRGGATQRGGGRGAPQRGGQRGGGRGGGQQRGRGGPPRASHTPGHMGRTGRQGGFTSAAQDKTLWVGIAQFLKKSTLLPACIFVFSKKRCEENADALSNQDFCNKDEKGAIYRIFQQSIARLKEEDRKLPQIERLRDLTSRGIAVHHGGLLPIVKELVEILFAQTLVKVLFATETFAMGLNLPTRTVVFSGYRKHDGHSFRNLLPGEYTQMAGRAGRRGLDTVGSVIIVPPGGDEAPPVADLQKMILGEPSKLRSQFRLTYNMILNLLRVEALKIEEMIKRSFSEHATQQLLPEHEKAVKVSEADLAKVKRDSCEICDAHMDECHQAGEDFKQLTHELYRGLLAFPVGRKMFTPGRLIVYNRDGIRRAGILLSEGASVKSQADDPTIHVNEIRLARDVRDSTDILPFLSAFRTFLTPLPKAKKHIQTKTLHVSLSDVECLTKTIPKGIIPDIFQGGDAYQRAKDKLHNLCKSWTTDIWEEMDMSKIRSLALQEVMEKRRKAEAAASNSAALACGQFVKHFAMCHDQWLIKEHIQQLRQSLADQNLQLLPDYEQRIQVLKDLSFIDDASRIQLKGKVACEIHSGDELVLTELILENVLADYEPAEIAALLSAFVFQEKTDSVPALTANLERGMKTIVEISEKVNAVQTLHQVIQSSEESNDFVSKPRFGLVEVVHEWARGMSFKNITDLTDVLEGTIVRTITRLDETCREVKNAARIIGDPELYAKMQTAQEMIKRDITAVASLYM